MGSGFESLAVYTRRISWPSLPGAGASSHCRQPVRSFQEEQAIPAGGDPAPLPLVDQQLASTPEG